MSDRSRSIDEAKQEASHRGCLELIHYIICELCDYQLCKCIILVINISCIKVLAFMVCRLLTSKSLKKSALVQKSPIFGGVKLTCEFLRRADILIYENREVFTDPCLCLYLTAKMFIVYLFIFSQREEVKEVDGDGDGQGKRGRWFLKFGDSESYLPFPAQ